MTDGTDSIAAGTPLETATTLDLGCLGHRSQFFVFPRPLWALEHKTERVHLIMPLWLHFLGKQNCSCSTSYKNLGVLQQPPAVHALAFTHMDPPSQRWRIQWSLGSTKSFMDPKRKTETLTSKAPPDMVLLSEPMSKYFLYEFNSRKFAS